MNKKLSENFSLNFIKTLMGIIFPMITFPYASRILGSVGIGKVNFSESIIGYFSIFAGLGISAYGIRESAKLRDDKEKLSKLASELFTINCLTTVVVYSVLIVCLFAFPYLQIYRPLLIVQSMTIIFTTLGMDWIFTALEEYRYITIRAVIFQAISFVMLFVLVRSKTDVIWYVFVCTFASVGSGVLNFFYSKKFVDIKLQFSKSLKKHVKPILYIFGTTLASSIYLDLDRTMIGIISGDKSVGLYTAAVKITKTASTLLACVTNVVLPRASYYLKSDDKKEFDNIIKVAANYTLMLAVPLAVGILVLNSEIIRIFCGRGFEGGRIPLAILGFNLIVSGINRVLAWAVLVPLGHENKVLYSTIIGAVSNLILNVIFINNFGIIGAAIATICSESIVMIWCIIFCHGKIDTINILKNIYQYLIAACLFVPINMFIKQFISSVFIIVIVQVILSVLCYTIVLRVLRNKYVDEIFKTLHKYIKVIC